MTRWIKVIIWILLIAICIIAGYAAYIFKDLRGIFTIHDTTPRQSTEYIVIHYDAVPRDCALYEIQETHLQRWHDYFPYTFYLKNGRVYLNRELDQKTSHCIGYNSKSIAVCINENSQENLQDQLHLLILVKLLQWCYNIPTDHVIGHGETTATKCPNMDMNKFREMLN